MHIDQANLSNLTKLWKKYGLITINEQILPGIHQPPRWPHRYWIDQYPLTAHCSTQGNIHGFSWLDKIPSSAIIPLWPIATEYQGKPTDLTNVEKHLQDKGWSYTFKQLAMYKCISTEDISLPTIRPEFKTTRVHTFEELKQWVEIGSEAFAYSIDIQAINNLLHDKAIRLFIGWQGQQAVACALLYKTEHYIGLHQFGVITPFQGQGIAKQFMYEIISISQLWQGKYIVLQASELGQPLYESLGFKSQFTIRNFQKIST